MYHGKIRDEKLASIQRRIVEIREAVDRIKEMEPGERDQDELDRLIKEAEDIQRQLPDTLIFLN